MNTTNNKTSLYDSVKKNGRINMERNNVKDRLDTIPRGEILTILDKFGEIVAIFIHGKILEGSGFFNPIIAYFPFVGWLKRCPSFELEGISTICFATQTEKEILFEQMKKEGYIWDGWNVIRGESAEEKEDEVKYELINKEGEVVNESPAEEEAILSMPNKKKCIIDKAIENKIAHNIKVAKDILDNTLPYYVINDKIEHLVRTTDKSLKRDLNNFNYFTNKEDVDEAIRRVKETLMNFQEEIQNRNK
jgi:hypothetical protein